MRLWLSNTLKTIATSVLVSIPFFLAYIISEAKSYYGYEACRNCFTYAPYAEIWGNVLEPLTRSEIIMSSATPLLLIGIPWSIAVLVLSHYKGTPTQGILISLVVSIIFGVSGCSLNAANDLWGF